MVQVRVRVLDADRAVRLDAAGADGVVAIFAQAYTAGDTIDVEVDQAGVYLVIALDDAMPPALVFMNGKSFALPIPVGADQKAYSPKAFSGNLHRLTVRCAQPQELGQHRNLALNPFDHPANATLFPHAQATTQTRGEAVFAARCAIDGETAAAGHGYWPYTSWGINRDPEAALTISFGRPVRVDRVTIYLRADFPHDAWWRQVSLTTDTGHTSVLVLVKTGNGQSFELRADNVEWVRLHALLQAADPSPFPALTQLEIWGSDVLP